MPLSQDQAKQVYAEAFFTKLAEHGIVPQDEAEQQELMQLAVNTRKLAAAHTRRTAVSRSSAVKQANAFLDRHFNGDEALDQLVSAHAKSAKSDYDKDGKKKGKKPDMAGKQRDAGGSC